MKDYVELRNLLDTQKATTTKERKETTSNTLKRRSRRSRTLDPSCTEFKTSSTDQPSDRHTRDQIPRPNYLEQIARAYREKYIKSYQPLIDHIKFLKSLRVCKTPTLGGHKMVCQKCANTHYVYFSCELIRCPICQSIKREQIADKLSSSLLAEQYVNFVILKT